MGFDEGFLGERMPLPPAPAQSITLDYEHFTVEQSVERRLAFYAAVNIDGAALVDVPRGDDWRLDPRAGDAQLGPELYSRNDLDRGHLVRRRDPVWGALEAARRANSDTFFYTNAAPQAAGFNQSPELWLGVEDHVLEHARRFDGRLSVLTGPVFAEGDPLYRGALIPRRFFKVAAWHDGEALAAAAFLLDQSAMLAGLGVPTAIPPLGGFRAFQVPVADVAGLTGLAMPELQAADRLVVVGARPGQRWRELGSVAEVVL
jgi:endonuclease G